MTAIATELLQPPDNIPPGFASLSQGVFHASTILFPDVATFLSRQAQASTGYSYGQNGTPTHYALASKLAQLEGGGQTVLVPSGLAAITLVSACVLSAGDHVLLPAAVYGPTLDVTRELFGKWGVRCSVYANDAGAGIAALFEARTRLVWVESPASNSLEMQDVPAIAATALAHGALVAMDNTWATPLAFRPLDYGVDFSIQALTKYVGGHSDLLMGAVTTRDPQRYQQLRETAELLGYYVSSDECFLALRGLPTLALRLERHFASALAIARALERHPALASLHYPPLESDPGHALWRRDFKLGSGLLSFTLHRKDLEAVEAFVAALRFFRLGNSWGAVHSLVAVAPLRAPQEGWLIRLHVGLEDPGDLLQDVLQALTLCPPSP
jgi:cystathionine beta-lyase